MKIRTGEKVYNFPAIEHAFSKNGNSGSVIFVTYYEGDCSVYRLAEGYTRTEGVAQLQAMYRVMEFPVSWIDVFDYSGYRNPATLYEDSNPEKYLE